MLNPDIKLTRDNCALFWYWYDKAIYDPVFNKMSDDRLLNHEIKKAKYHEMIVRGVNTRQRRV